MESSIRLFNTLRLINIKVLNRRCHTKVSKDFADKVMRIGQPTTNSHPHLLRPGEVMPETNAEEYRKRRYKLMEKIAEHSASQGNSPSMEHIVVIPSATKQYMSEEIPYVFRQNSDFLYLTGMLEPNSLLVLHNLPDHSLPKHLSTLFVRSCDSYTEKWEGPRTSPDGARSLFEIDQALHMEDFQQYLDCLIRSKRMQSLTFWYDCTDAPHSKAHEALIRYAASKCNGNVLSPRGLIHEMRVIKSTSEITLIKRACKIGSEAVKCAMKSSRPFISEHDLYARVDFESRVRGASYLAYPPVVAGGERANIIHYINNNQIIKDGEMVLMDAGCEYGGYSSDITRTWPVNLKFTSAQKCVYEALLRVQESLIQLCQSSRPSLNHLYQVMCSLLGTHLQSAGIIPAPITDQQLVQIIHQLCPHHVSHYLGMDIHDTHSVSKNIPLRSGMVITIEPGVYISENNTTIPKEFRSMGIRIEDDILITDTGAEILTESCPKYVNDIEGLKR